MTTREINWLRDSHKLLFNYNHDQDIRELINSTFYYQNRSIFFYINNLISFSPKYYGYYQKAFRNYSPSYFANRQVRTNWKDKLPDLFQKFFFQCEQDQVELDRLVTTLTSPASVPSYYSPDEIRYLTAADQIINPAQKQTAFERFLKDIDRKRKIKTARIQAATNSLTSRITKYSSRFATLSDRQQLIAEKLFTRKEIDAIINANLIARIPKTDSLTTKEGVLAKKQWDDDVYKIARAIFEKRDPVKEFTATKPGEIPNRQFPLITPFKEPVITINVPREPEQAEVSIPIEEPPYIPPPSPPSIPRMPSFPSRPNLRLPIPRMPGLAGKGALTAVRAVPLLANPVTLAVGILLGIILLFLLSILLKELALLPPYELGATPAEAGELVKITKTGTPEVANPPEGAFIAYEITVQYLGPGEADINVTDTIPDGTEFVSAPSQKDTPVGIESGGVVTWGLLKVPSKTPLKLELVVRPTKSDFYAINNGATANVGKTYGGTPTGGTGGSCPTQAEIDANKKSPESCHYFGLGVDLYNIDLPQPAIDKYTADYSPVFISHGGTPTEFQNRLTYLINSSKAAGINPVLLMGYWRTENNFSVSDRSRDMGCAKDAINFYEQVDCTLGVKDYSNPVKNPVGNCARSRDANSVGCNSLKDVRRILDQKNPIHYPIATLDDFAESHGSRDPGLDGPGTTNNNCVNTYNKLVEVALSLNACFQPKTTTPTTIGTITPTPTNKTGQCQGNAIKFTTDNRLLPLPNQNSCARTITEACGRPGTCVVPAKIVMHITDSPLNAEETYQFFATGGQGAGTGSHFIIGPDGHIIQLVEMLDNQVERAYAVLNYSDHISLELVKKGDYNSKAEVPAAQYQAALSLVRALMTQYNIPLGNLEYTYKSTSNAFNPQIPTGIYGHYQLNPGNKTDPGIGFMRDFREDLK